VAGSVVDDDSRDSPGCVTNFSCFKYTHFDFDVKKKVLSELRIDDDTGGSKTDGGDAND